jgi:inositol phosphorylceramide mannosyltransferase catalytic subunit
MSNQQPIPRIFHSVWLGPSPLPERERLWIEGWKDMHPGWEHLLWTDHYLPPLRRPDLFAAGKNWAQKSDVLRFELMAGIGGVYLDTDMECLQNIEPLLDESRAFLGFEKPGRIAQGIIGAEPGHPFFESVMSALPEGMPFRGQNLQETGPDFTGRVFRQYADESPVWHLDEAGTGKRTGMIVRDALVIFEPWVFYPYYMGEAWVPTDHPESFAAHHWAGSWLGHD